jgi:hypothetical protein
MLLVQRPQAAKMLAEELAALAGTPEQFAALTASEQKELLQSAAVAAENRADALAAQKLKIALQELKYGDADEQRRALDALDGARYYLSAENAANAVAARSLLAEYREKRAKTLAAFASDLARRLSAGEVTAENLLARDSGGWIMADESPEPVAAALGEALRVRYERMHSSPLGPWTKAQADLLAAAVARPEIAGELGADAAHALGEKFASLGRVAENQWSVMPGMSAALSAFKSGRPGARQIKLVASFWKDAARRQFEGRAGRAHFLAAMVREGGEFPSMSRIQKAAKAAASRARNEAWVLAAGLAAAVAASTQFRYGAGAAGLLLLVALIIRAQLLRLWAEDLGRSNESAGSELSGPQIGRVARRRSGR